MDADKLAEFERWLSELTARMEEPVNLKDVFGRLDPFDTLDLLSKLASLQLVPENCDYLLRLEAATAYAATKPIVLNGPHISNKRQIRQF